MLTHELKTWPIYFERVLAQEKPFEVRRNDRDFQAGDKLLLREWNPDTQQYSGRTINAIVSYVLNGGDFGIQQGYCVLGLHLPFNQSK
jgi:hypothetical protein